MAKKKITSSSGRTLKAQREVFEIRFPTRSKTGNPFLKMDSDQSKNTVTGTAKNENTRGKERTTKKQRSGK